MEVAVLVERKLVRVVGMNFYRLENGPVTDIWTSSTARP
jgi:hypothetical protein